MKAKGHSNRFKLFCKSESMDTFLHACIDYFEVFFALRAIEEEEAQKNSAERAAALAEGKAPPEGVADAAAGGGDGGLGSGAASSGGSPSTSSRVRMEKELEKRAKLREVSLVYATILLKYSNYANTQQERQFFESLYDFAKRVLFTIHSRKHWHAIENELDRVFRSPHFNLSQRKNDANLKGGGASTASYKEMFDKWQGHESGRSPFGGGGGPRRSSVHQALAMRSPIISEIFPTPKEVRWLGS